MNLPGPKRAVDVPREDGGREMPTRSARWSQRVTNTLAKRIITLVLALLLVLQIASFSAIQTSLQSHALRVLPEQLATAERVLTSVLDQRAAGLVQGAHIIANDYSLKQAFAVKDQRQLDSALEGHGARLKAKIVGLLDPEFKLVTFSVTDGEDRIDSLVATLATLAETLQAAGRPHSAASHLIVVGGKLHQLVLAPMVTQRKLQAWVLLGVPLERRMVDDMRQLSAQQFTLLTRAQPGAAWQLVMSSLPPSQVTALAQQRALFDGAPQQMHEVDVEGERLAVRALVLGGGQTTRGGPGGASDADVLALVSASIDDAVRLNRELQLALLVITVVGFAAFGIGSVFTARYVTNPLRELTEAAERLGDGDFATPMRRLRRVDEIGSLAKAFERMRVNVADQQAEVLKLAYWDSLTGLPNRLQFRQSVAAAIADGGATSATVAVLMLDLDRFKHVNDVLGYRLGDLVLTHMAARLTDDVVRGDGLVARLGGDEFAVLLTAGGASAALALARRIAHAFDVPLELEDHTIDLGAGIGIACWPEHAGDADTLLSRAEVAMYAAKRRNAEPMLYDPAIDAGSAQTLSLLSELRRALDQHELCAYLQPKLGLADGELVGAEVLVRWRHPTRGLIAPLQFIPFAEQTGFIRYLTLWVFDQTVRHWAMLNADAIAIPLAVNLSTRDLLDPELPAKFASMLDRHRVAADAICLEITESAIMDDPQRAMATLERLAAAGFALSIDDFGTGYSSLAYLKRLPVDELKIDKSFVLGMAEDSDDMKIVRSTIDLAHNLGLSVVAEGVENSRTWDLLRKLDCDHAQGYHMAQPMPIGEFRQWARRAKEPQPTNSVSGASLAQLH